MSATTIPAIIPDPGFYEGIPDAVYHAWDCASAHRLMMLERGLSPAHVRESIDHPDPETSALAVGRALHLRVLQPEQFDARVDQGPLNPKTSRCYGRDTKAWEDAQAERPDVTLLTSDERERVLRVAEAVERHPTMRQLLSAPGNRVELTGIVHEDGLTSKIRLDLQVPEFGAVVDLKSTDCAARGTFERSLFNLQYHLQGGFYDHQAHRLGFNTEHYLLCAIEKQPPYGCAVYRLSPDVLAWAWNRLQEPMATMAQCYATGVWPGYGTDIEDIALPEWVMRQVRAATVLA